MKPIRNFADFRSYESASARLRGLMRDAAIWPLSLGRDIGRTDCWVRFPYYHHVFDDERYGFARQLDYMRGFGEFISLDDVTNLLETNQPIDGRYFCITFDDGFKNNLTNAVPILLDAGATATFFVATGYIGLDVKKDRNKLLSFFDHGQSLLEFLDWDDCQKMIDVGMTIGSHTVNHSRMSKLETGTAERELAESKRMIEEHLNRPCEHFCSPFGIPGRDFNVDRDPRLAKSAGYRSMSTTERGVIRRGDNPHHIYRDHILANWGNYQLRYFLSLN